MNDRASVVMTVFNGRAFVLQQMDSVLTQLRPDDELIVVDDASTDDSMALCQMREFPNRRIIRNSRNLGVIASFERGLSLARGDIVFLCDQDDLWLPGKRDAFMAEFARDSTVCLVISDAEIMDESGERLAPSFMATRGGFRGTVLATLWRNRYLGCAMAVRRSVLELALPFPSGVPMHDMWLGVVANASGGVVYLPTPYLRYRRHRANVTPLRSREPWTRLVRWRVGLLLMLVRRRLSVRLGIHTAVRPREGEG